MSEKQVWQYPEFVRLFHTSTSTSTSTLESVELSKAWFTPYFLCAEPNVNWISSTWSDTGAISDSDGVPSVDKRSTDPVELNPFGPPN